MRYIQPIAILLLASLLSGCATIFSGTTQRVTIDSTPPGAEIVIDGRMMGTTPAKVRLDRDINAFIDDGKDIELHMDGYFKDGYYLGTDIEPTTILNVLNPLGFAVDAVTGAMMRYDSNYYNFRLMPMEESRVPYRNDPNATASNNDDGADDDYVKLMNLVELYEEGKLTEEEFEAQKAKIFEHKQN